ncbi:hypothetical protein ACNKHM_08155 [Shigella sonnei]
MGTDIFVVGETAAACAAPSRCWPLCAVNKVDSARCCGFSFGRLEKQPVFDVNKSGADSARWLTVKTLPAVFSRDGSRMSVVGCCSRR